MERDRTGSWLLGPGFPRVGTGLANLRGPGRIRDVERNLDRGMLLWEATTPQDKGQSVLGPRLDSQARILPLSLSPVLTPSSLSPSLTYFPMHQNITKIVGFGVKLDSNQGSAVDLGASSLLGRASASSVF